MSCIHNPFFRFCLPSLHLSNVFVVVSLSLFSVCLLFYSNTLLSLILLSWNQKHLRRPFCGKKKTGRMSLVGMSFPSSSWWISFVSLTPLFLLKMRHDKPHAGRTLTEMRRECLFTSLPSFKSEEVRWKWQRYSSFPFDFMPSSHSRDILCWHSFQNEVSVLLLHWGKRVWHTRHFPLLLSSHSLCLSL